MKRCPKFRWCSSSMCPLDKDYKLRVKGGNECQYLRDINRIKMPPEIAKIAFLRPENGLNSGAS